MFRSPVTLAVTALLGAATLTACATSASPGATPARAQGTEPSTSPTPTCTPLPLERRAAAVLVVGIPGVTTADEPLPASLAQMGIGGIFLSEPNIESAEQVRALVDGIRAQAPGPLVISTDEESGRVAVTREIVGAGPSPRRLARQQTPEQVRTFARGIGERLAEVGVDLDLAPLLDLDDSRSSGVIGDRSFSKDPEIASTYGLAFSAGLMDAGVRPTVKHFPGHGRSTTDTHAEAAVVEESVDVLRETDLLPFQRAIDAGAPVVMLNHLGYRAMDADLPASLSPKAYALLREMGFEGVAMTDSLGMGAVNLRWDFPEAAVRAIEAGADIALATDGNQALRMRDALVEAVTSGRLPEERLNEAAARAFALAGGDPLAMSCTAATTPTLSVPPTASPAG